MRSMRALRPALVSVIAAGLLTGCMLFTSPPKDLDYSRTRTSEAGRYRATIHPQGDTIPQGKLQRWTLHVETAARAWFFWDGRADSPWAQALGPLESAVEHSWRAGRTPRSRP